MEVRVSTAPGLSLRALQKIEPLPVLEALSAVYLIASLRPSEVPFFGACIKVVKNTVHGEGRMRGRIRKTEANEFKIKNSK